MLVLGELAPGAATGTHTHPGDDFAYVLEGSISLEVKGKPPVTFKQGATYHLPPEQVHNVKNLSSTAPAKVLEFFVTKKGQPLTHPVK